MQTGDGLRAPISFAPLDQSAMMDAPSALLPQQVASREPMSFAPLDRLAMMDAPLALLNQQAGSRTLMTFAPLDRLAMMEAPSAPPNQRLRAPTSFAPLDRLAMMEAPRAHLGQRLRAPISFAPLDDQAKMKAPRAQQDQLERSRSPLGASSSEPLAQQMERRELQAARLRALAQETAEHGMCRELQAQPSARERQLARAFRALNRIHRGGKRGTEIYATSNLDALTPSSLPLLAQPFGAFTIIHHISHPSHQLASDNTPNRAENPQTLINYKTLKLQMGTYNIRGLKRLGRQTELSHLIDKHRFSIIGIQETKCSGNTVTPLAAGFLLNSSDQSLPGKEEHRGTGLVIAKTLAPALTKTYLGSSRFCGALFLAKPTPLLILSAYAPTAAADLEEKQGFYNNLGEILRENGELWW